MTPLLQIIARTNTIIIEQLAVDEHAITPTAHFYDDLGADSLDTVELIMAAEEEFNIEISDESAEDVLRVQDAYALIDRLVNK